MKNFGSGETYIGDGIYASFDGWQIRLHTSREYDDHEVFLEPDTWATLVEYAAERMPYPACAEGV